MSKRLVLVILSEDHKPWRQALPATKWEERKVDEVVALKVWKDRDHCACLISHGVGNEREQARWARERLDTLLPEKKDSFDEIYLAMHAGRLTDQEAEQRTKQGAYAEFTGQSNDPIYLVLCDLASTPDAATIDQLCEQIKKNSP